MMEKKERIRLIIGASINMVIFGLALFCLTNFLSHLFRGDHDNKFIYFTNMSALSFGLVALPNAFLLLISAIKGKMIYPTIFSVIKFIALSMISLTFFTVLCFIAPLTSFKEMYENMRFVTHLVIPLLVFISYFFFEEKVLFSWKISLFGAIPPVVYTFLYGLNVVLLKTWPDIYRVNEKGIWYVFAIITIIFNFVLVQGLYFLKKVIIKKLLK